MVDDGVWGRGRETNGERDMLARICGRDKRVPGVIKFPGEQQPGSFAVGNFPTRRRRINRAAATASFLSLFSLAVTRETCRRTSSQRSLFFRQAENSLCIYLLPSWWDDVSLSFLSFSLYKINPLRLFSLTDNLRLFT